MLPTNDDPEVISIYTRAQAIEDGILVDVSATACEAGFKIPVAITVAVYESHVKVPPGVEAQDEAGRLWDVLWMTRYAISRSAPDEAEVPVKLHVRNDNRRPRLVTLKAIVGPGDDAEPVITILTDED